MSETAARMQTLWKQLLADSVLSSDWSLDITPTREGRVWSSEKRITSGELAEEPLKLLLREVAHAMCPDDPPPGHSISWLNCYLFLLARYLDFAPPTRSDMIAYAVQQGFTSFDLPPATGGVL